MATPAAASDALEAGINRRFAFAGGCDTGRRTDGGTFFQLKIPSTVAILKFSILEFFAN
jgi:hypothetical protein